MPKMGEGRCRGGGKVLGCRCGGEMGGCREGEPWGWGGWSWEVLGMRGREGEGDGRVTRDCPSTTTFGAKREPKRTLARICLHV